MTFERKVYTKNIYNMINDMKLYIYNYNLHYKKFIKQIQIS